MLASTAMRTSVLKITSGSQQNQKRKRNKWTRGSSIQITQSHRIMGPCKGEFLFAVFLFNDAVSSSYYSASNENGDIRCGSGPVILKYKAVSLIRRKLWG
jgi:hypothetical protein